MSLHDPNFKYRPSFDTDVGRHLRKFKREQQAAAQARLDQHKPRAPVTKVAEISRRGRS